MSAKSHYSVKQCYISHFPGIVFFSPPEEHVREDIENNVQFAWSLKTEP